MRRKLIIGSVLVLGCLLQGAYVFGQTEMGTAFTYQGRLTDNGVPADDDYDFQFKLCDDPAAACQVAGTAVVDYVDDHQVDDGLFTVEVDFGSDVFNGRARWLELAVRAGASTGAYTTLTPRQKLTPTPHALALPGLWTQQNGPTDSPNLIGGYSENIVNPGAVGATISGGGGPGAENRVFDDHGTIGGGMANEAHKAATVGGGLSNEASGDLSTVGGGLLNVASGVAATVGGGGFFHGNTASDWSSTVSGGDDNVASERGATVSGGEVNRAGGLYSTISGGHANIANGHRATVPGGLRNWANGDYSLAAGRRARALHQGTFVWADSEDNDFPSTSDNTFLIRAAGGVGIGKNDPAEQLDVEGNIHASGTITSGSTITINGTANTISSNNDLELHVSSGRALRIETDPTSPNLIGGSSANNVTSGFQGATIGGGGNVGLSNRVFDHYGTIGGGAGNEAGAAATVGGGYRNEATGSNCTVGGGTSNVAEGAGSTVGGGGFGLNGNTATGTACTVGGGEDNIASVGHSVASGGRGNRASSNYATVPGGLSNTAGGAYSLAAGRQAKANDAGTFVWADSADVDFPSTSEPNFTPTADQFLARTTGGAVFVSAINGAGDSTGGVELPAGGGAWSSLSSRSAKENFASVNHRELLSRLSAISIETWNYKAQDPSIRHIGPMAQDFHNAFGVGEDENRISTIDTDGIALAAIQGLYDMVNEKDAKIADLEARLAALEKLIGRLDAGREGGAR